MSVRSSITCMKVSLLFTSLLLFQAIDAQYQFMSLDKQMEDAKKELGKDAIVLVFKDGKTIHQKAVGEFTPKTQVPIGSASQWLTAALVMSYVDAGKISLDDKVSKYIPAMVKFSKGYITIRDCLSHKTGMEADKTFSFLGKKKYSSLEEEVNDLIAKREIESNPGLEFKYSNVGPDIAARVLEIVNHRGFEQLMQEKITRPLMMRNTSFSSLTAVNPSSGALSTASDYLNFLSMILNGGMFNGKRILSEKAISDMQSITTTPTTIKLAPKAAAGFNYGMGSWILELDEKGNANVLAHPGLAGTWPMIDKCRNYAVIFMTKGDLGEEKRALFMEMKKTLDEQFKPTCN